MRVWTAALALLVIALVLWAGWKYVLPWVWWVRPGPAPPQPHSKTGKLLIGYFTALYPQTGQTYLEGLSDTQLQQLWNSLYWYYLPLVQQIPDAKRAPLQNNSPATWTQYFAADGTDEGNYGSPGVPGTFFCSVFSAQLSTPVSEYTCYGQPYQAIQFIRMTGRRNGFPNNAYIEPVAFVCESLGKSLLTAPKCLENAPAQNCPDSSSPIPNCNSKNSMNSMNSRNSSNSMGSWNFAPARKALAASPCANTLPTCPPQSPCYKCGKPGGGCCSYTNQYGMTDVCCWDYSKNAPDTSCCAWPTVCAAYASPSTGSVYDNYCATPCSWQCDPDSGTCDWTVDGTSWSQWLLKQRGTSDWVGTLLNECRPCNTAGSACQLPESWQESSDFESTMFYWLPGYGRFMNFGQTGVYFQYVHFLLTCPKYAANGKQWLRWTFPQVLQTSVLNQGNTELQQQLQDLTSGQLTDRRQYLEGYVTTLRGTQYEGNKGTPVPNKLPWGNRVNNVNGQLNPLDDTFLQHVDAITVTRYYSAADRVANPQYNKRIAFTPDQAVCLVAGASIYGATGAQAMGYFSGAYPDKYGTGFGTWPFGTFFSGSNLGGCAYNTVYALGWDSVQLTMMPTGTGSAKYCNYPAYDFELVFIGSKQDVCQNKMKLLDPTQDWDNYTQFGFVQGSGDATRDAAAFNVVPLDASKMRLSERNVPCCWGTQPMPNATQYAQPDPPVADTSNCPYRDNVYRYYYDKGGNTGIPPSCR